MFPLYGIRDCRVDGWGYFRDVDARQREVLQPVRYRWVDDTGLQEHIVDKGYISDGASKWFIWRLMGYPWGSSAVGALLHDRCFTERFRLSTGDRVTLEYSAALYLAFLEFSGVAWFQRNVEYLAVLSPTARELWYSHDKEFRLNP